MDLTTIERVKVHLESKGTPIKYGSRADNLLLALIAIYSPTFERKMNRQALTVERTMQFNLRPLQQVIRLPAWPVVSVSSVINSQARDWTDDPLPQSDYYVNQDTGMLTVDGRQLLPGHGVLQVVWTGGMALDTDAFVAAYPEVAGACDEQVAYHYTRSKNIGASSISGRDGTVTNEGALNLLPTVKAALAGHRALVVG